MRVPFFCALFVALVAPCVHAQDSLTVEKLEASLKYQRGTITLGDGLATAHVPAEFRFLGPEDSRRLLMQGWGNPEMEAPLGMIVPAKVSPMSDEGWAVIISYEADGYVDDADAADIDYAALLAQMQAETAMESQARVAAGYEAIELKGWAAPPRYDADAYKLYWAQELKFGEDEPHTLNYNVRVLGRRGVLVLNAVAAIPMLPTVEADMRTVMSFVDFNQGHRYSDFVRGADEVASYGVPALVAGKAASGNGVLGLVMAGFTATGALIVLSLVGAATAVSVLLRRGRRAEASA